MPIPRGGLPLEATQLSTLLFWIVGVCVFYAYVGYPILIWALACCFGRPRKTPIVADEDLPSVSLVIVAHNEEALIGKRIESALDIDCPPEKLEVLVVCDGCSRLSPT